jgi:hypothetical protein
MPMRIPIMGWMTITGWWFFAYASGKKKLWVSWDDDIPNWMERHKIPWFQSTIQWRFVGHGEISLDS